MPLRIRWREGTIPVHTKSFSNGLLMKLHAVDILLVADGRTGLSVLSAVCKLSLGRRREGICIVGSAEARFRLRQAPFLIEPGRL